MLAMSLKFHILKFGTLINVTVVLLAVGGVDAYHKFTATIHMTVQPISGTAPVPEVPYPLYILIAHARELLRT